MPRYVRNSPTGCCSCQPQSQVAGKVRHGGEVVLGRDLAEGDAQIAGDAGLGVERAVVVAGVVNVGGVTPVVVRHITPGRRVRPEPAPKQTGSEIGSTRLGVVVVAKVHRLQQCRCLIGHGRHRIAHHHQRRRQPAVVDAGEKRVDRAAIDRPDGELVTGERVVPVVELTGWLVTLQGGERLQCGGHAFPRLSCRDDPQLPRRQRAP